MGDEGLVESLFYKRLGQSAGLPRLLILLGYFASTPHLFGQTVDHGQLSEFLNPRRQLTKMKSRATHVLLAHLHFRVDATQQKHNMPIGRWSSYSSLPASFRLHVCPTTYRS